MNVLITGGNGYIGSHTAIKLLEDAGNKVVSIDNFINSNPTTLGRIEKISGRRLDNYALDVRDYEGMKNAVKQHLPIDGIIHFAALKAVGESVENPLLYYDININGIINLLRLAAELKIPNFIFSSSCSVYGNVDKLPVSESTPLSKSESPYANTKRIGEEIISDFAKVQDVNCISLRYFNPVGAHPSGLNGENPINKPNNLLPVITNTAIGKMDKMFVHGTDYPTRDGSCIRDYVHVMDIADAHIKALEYLLANSNKKRYELYNLGTGNGVSVIEAIKAFEDHSGVKLNYELGPRREGDVAAIFSDSSLAEKNLNWKPLYGLKEMVRSAWAWENQLKKEKNG